MRSRRAKAIKSGVHTFLDDREDDEIFIVEQLLKRNQNQYLVKCVGYEPEWMESVHIPSFLLELYQKTGKTKIPLPNIQSSSTNGSGSIVFNTLTWKSDATLRPWAPEMTSLFPGHNSEQSSTDETEGGPLTCNTKKDKDSRFHRHTAGIFIG